MKFYRFSQICPLLLALSNLFTSCAVSHPQNDSLVEMQSSLDPVLESPLETPLDSLLDESDTESDEANSNEKTAPVDDTIWDLSDVDTSSISPQRKLISFTFDDAPSKTLENIFAVYVGYNEAHSDCPAFATIFFNGGRFDSQTPHLLATACAMRFELGNHTFSHYDLTKLSKAELQWEIEMTDRLLQKADGKTRHLLRAPFGKTNDFVKEASTSPLIDWAIDTLDWTGVSADEIYRTVYDNRFSGAIVLMHDGYPHTVDALKRLLPDLYADGYQVVSVSQMAKMHGCTLMKGKVYIRARKQH